VREGGGKGEEDREHVDRLRERKKVGDVEEGGRHH
jgi:hypothetical protein